jgi:phenylalanyl-tRNA synthetase alpha subunit
MIVEKLTKSDYFKDFTIFSSPEIVKEFETFDLFYFADNHVARRPSDSYFLQKTDNKDTNLLLRPHTTIMWYHYLVKSNGIEKLGIDSTKYN